MENDKQSPKPSKGYGKLSKKQWWIIYIVAGIIVYGLIYFWVVQANNDGNDGNKDSDTNIFSY